MGELANRRIEEIKNKIQLLKWRIEIYQEENKDTTELNEKIIQLENYIRIANA